MLPREAAQVRLAMPPQGLWKSLPTRSVKSLSQQISPDAADHHSLLLHSEKLPTIYPHSVCFGDVIHTTGHSDFSGDGGAQQQGLPGLRHG